LPQYVLGCLLPVRSAKDESRRFHLG
jgi:hypothetical protein